MPVKIHFGGLLSTNAAWHFFSFFINYLSLLSPGIVQSRVHTKKVIAPETDEKACPIF